MDLTAAAPRGGKSNAFVGDAIFDGPGFRSAASQVTNVRQSGFVPVAGPVRAEFDLALTCSAKGVLAGTGTLLAGSSEIPVTVKGRVRKQVVTLTIQGSRTSLKLTRGKIAAGSIVSASWSTKGFGGSAKGTRRFSLAPQ